MVASSIFDLTGKVVVITGGGGLLGRQLSLSLARHGGSIVIADLEVALAPAVEMLKEAGESAIGLELDITSEASVASVVASLVRTHGKIDVWINNAYPRTSDWGDHARDVKLSSFQKNLDSHLGGYFLCCQKVGESMRKIGGGSIINMSSIYGITGPDFSIYGDTGMTVQVAYSAIKGGIITMTRYFASYWGADQVRVNAISPGGIFNAQPADFIRNYEAKTPLRRMGRADDLNGAAIYLASNASSYVTGHNLVVDGGWTVV
jgi:NAD(P)-dependent dehydrogenase (short-subunit alcohol dehydrogenase family)